MKEADPRTTNDAAAVKREKTTVGHSKLKKQKGNMTTYSLPAANTSAENDEVWLSHVREQYQGKQIKIPTIRFFLLADTPTEVFELIHFGLSKNDPREFYQPEESYVLERVGQKQGSDTWHITFLKATSMERYEQDVRQGRVFFEAIAKAVEDKTGPSGRGRVVYDGPEVDAMQPIAAAPETAMIQ